MGTGEGIQQELRYESALAQERLLKQFNLKEAEFHFIFLTLDTTVLPGSSKFKGVHYNLFLNGNWVVNNATLNMLLEDFKEKIKEFYSPIFNPIKSLTEGIELNSIQQKICWQTILFKEFKNEHQFDIEWGEVGGAGRNNFLFLISKSNWKADRSFEEEELAKTFNIHEDTCINLLNNDKNIITD